MSDYIQASIARIFTNEGAVVGAGFLVSKKHLLTCAHVVLKALGNSWNNDETSQDPIILDFPLSSSGNLLTAHVICWQPIQANRNASFTQIEDVAVLELSAPLPFVAKPPCLLVADNYWGHNFRAFGFPVGHDDGVWVRGELRQG